MIRSALEIYDLALNKSETVLQSEARLEAPNWHPDGWLLLNADGQLWRVDPENPKLTPIDIGACGQCNNDHGFSPDGATIWFSTHRGSGSEIWHIPVKGGLPEPADLPSPSWWHGISPDGAQITYAAVREGCSEVDIYLCPANGGAETRLSHGGAHSDGPDFSPCGKWIWYNSDVTGHAQIWRIKPDGSDAHQVFDDEFVNWFPHPSPCGQHVLYLAYPVGTLGHPADLQVELRLMTPEGQNRRTVAAFFGGQGAINVPCWAPDSSAFAYIRHFA